MNYIYQIALSFAMEDQELVQTVYHYLTAESVSVFYAPALECQTILSGRNQREVFYEIFGLNTQFVALFVSRSYVLKKVPMEEAGIAIAKHGGNGSVIPVYLDDTQLPADLFDPNNTNYFKSDNPAQIAAHLAAKVKVSDVSHKNIQKGKESGNVMNIKNNIAEKQLFIQTLNGSIEL